VLEQVLTIGGIDKVGTGTFRRVKYAGVEVALRDTILRFHEAVEVNVATIDISQKYHTTGRTNLYTPLIDLLLRLC